MNDAENVVRAKAVALYSGGLDSTLAVEVLLRAGVEVVALNHYSVFDARGAGPAAPSCALITRDISEQMLKLVRNPQYGFGKNANPCLDCKQMMYTLAWQEAGRQGAQFIATGEVLGQRPMSQRADAFRRMERGAGLEGLVVRPLSAKLLPPTIPEQQGLLRREDMLDLCGRGRKRQIELAARWGITDYPTPAGGCKLTDPNFADRVFRLARMDRLSLADLRAVRHGRLFEVGPGAYALVGRNREDNDALLADAPAGSLILELQGRPGPLACLVGEPTEEAVAAAKRLVVRHSRFKDLTAGAVGAWPVEQARVQMGGIESPPAPPREPSP
jgi:hypothetical protein